MNEEYIRKEDALDCCPLVIDKHGEIVGTSAEYDRISELEPVDVVPVVRCRDCKYAHMTYGGDCKYCDRIKEMTDDGDGGYGGSLYFPGDWFCADGERREDDE